MSDPVSALGGVSYKGFAEVSEAGLQGMISLRGDLADAGLAVAVKAAMGCEMPQARGVVSKGAQTVAWMSPDELLLLVPYADAPATVAKLEKKLAKAHALVADVSDARALFRVRGEKADQVLMKLCPVDFARLPEGEMRRTRAAQVAAALWRSAPQEVSVLVMRSVAAYAMGILEHSARSGSEISSG